MIGKRALPPLLTVAGYALVVRPRLRSWGATTDESKRSYPGDALIPEATGQTTMAVTLPAPPERVWPWLVQMGCGRAGFYSWDRLDNGGYPSAEQIMPEWQDLKEGDRVPVTPDGDFWFGVEIVDPPRTLVLRGDVRLPGGGSFDPRGAFPTAYTDGIWAFHLTPTDDGGTRLVVRTRDRGRPWLADRLIGLLFDEPVHPIMQRRQFARLRRRLTTAPAPAAMPEPAGRK